MKELQYLQTNGIKLDDKTVKMKVKAFVRNAPDRTFLKCIKGHTAFTACEHCKIVGCKLGFVVPERGETAFRKI